jgi:ribosome-associated protein
MLVVNRHLTVPLQEFQFTFARSSGPGGQNVNKVSSKAQLRWPVLESPSLPEPVRQRFVAKFAHRITAEGHLLVTSQRFRDAGRNVTDCLEKLRAMLLEVAVPPKLRRPTRPTRSSVRRRLEGKRKTSQKKEGRRRPARDE